MRLEGSDHSQPQNLGPPGGKGRLGRLTKVLSMVAATALVLIALRFVAQAYLNLPGAFNSDDLFLVNLADDLLAGKDVVGWHLPGVPISFPIWPCCFPAGF